jgi:hypothetical protein
VRDERVENYIDKKRQKHGPDPVRKHNREII